MCTMTPLVAVATDSVTGCSTQDKVEMNDCTGGCGIMMKWCCVPSDYTYQLVNLSCSNKTTYPARVSIHYRVI